MLSDLENQANKMAEAILQAEREHKSFNALEHSLRLTRMYSAKQITEIGYRAREIIQEMRKSEVHPHQAKG